MIPIVAKTRLHDCEYYKRRIPYEKKGAAPRAPSVFLALSYLPPRHRTQRWPRTMYSAAPSGSDARLCRSSSVGSTRAGSGCCTARCERPSTGRRQIHPPPARRGRKAATPPRLPLSGSPARLHLYTRPRTAPPRRPRLPNPRTTHAGPCPCFNARSASSLTALLRRSHGNLFQSGPSFNRGRPFHPIAHPAFYLLRASRIRHRKSARALALARGSSGKTRTYNPSVNSRMLCH